MIAGQSAPRLTLPSIRRPTLAAGLALCALAAFGLEALLQQYALGIVAAGLGVAVTVWRPRYGLYLAVLLAVAFEATTLDPLMYPGWIAQSDVSSWSPLRFVNFSPIEALVALTALVVLGRAVVLRRRLRSAEFFGAVLLFLALIFLSIGWGMLRGGGSLNKALWETRSLVLGGLVALLVPELFACRAHAEKIIDLLCLSMVLISVDIVWRRFVILGQVHGGLDLDFGHETPVFMNFVVMLLLARLIWPASKWQRLSALAIPLILWAETLTERRAGWVGLDLALILLAVFIFRLRRKHFFLIVLPLSLLYCGYLGIFWNAQGAIAQPARAVRSINDPEGRDQSSNIYRQIENADVRENIHAHPVTGLGFGQPYVFYIPLPDVSWWPFWHYMSHNGILFVWMKMGPIGFVVLMTIIGAAIVRGIQLLKRATHDKSAPYLVALVSGLLMVSVYSYVDISVTSVRLCVFLGLLLGVIGTWGKASVLRQGELQ